MNKGRSGSREQNMSKIKQGGKGGRGKGVRANRSRSSSSCKGSSRHVRWEGGRKALVDPEGDLGVQRME